MISKNCSLFLGIFQVKTKKVILLYIQHSEVYAIIKSFTNKEKSQPEFYSAEWVILTIIDLKRIETEINNQPTTIYASQSYS